jgi:hypothetical protein
MFAFYKPFMLANDTIKVAYYVDACTRRLVAFRVYKIVNVIQF